MSCKVFTCVHNKVCKNYIGGKLYGTNNGILHYIL